MLTYVTQVGQNPKVAGKNADYHVTGQWDTKLIRDKGKENEFKCFLQSKY